MYSKTERRPQLIENEITENQADNYGGGIYSEEDEPTIEGNYIAQNSSTNGGGFYTRGNGRPDVSGNTFYDNSAVEGGGIFCDSLSKPKIRSNLLRDNVAFGYGGGIKIVGTPEVTIDSNEIISNQAPTGGGIFCSNAFSAEISYNHITENSGGGMTIYHYRANITGNTINGNFNATLGGGLYCVGNHNILNNVISENEAMRGGGVYIANSNYPVFRNNISYMNLADFGGGLYCKDANPMISNSIFWADSAPDGNEIYIESGTPDVAYCDVQGGFQGQGNVDLEPRFRDPANDDFHLMATEYGFPYDSPCIDIGNPADLDSLLAESWGLGTAYCDMGAFGGGDRQGSIINIPGDFLTIQEGINAAAQNDTILVAPGTYFENIRIDDLQVFIGSLYFTTGDTSYISSTIIDGSDYLFVVRFSDCENKRPILTGFTIQNGRSNAGGGIYCDNSSPEISFNRITDNISTDGGGGIHCEGLAPLIHDNIIDGNHEDGYWGGGGIFCIYSDALIYNNLILKNNSTSRGGALSFQNCEPVIMNNTISGNISEIGGGLFIINSHPTIINSIFWGDSANTNGDEIYVYSGSPDVSYSDIEGGWTGDGNIDTDPLFRETAGGNLHLMSVACGDPFDSPCIDAGNPDLFDDWLGCERGLGEWRSDMGAYGGWDSVITSIIDNNPEIPDKFLVSRNYPNPFNGRTTISFTLHEPQEVRLIVYDLLGRQVRVLLDENRGAGAHSITFDASHLASGVYFYRLEAGETSEIRKMILLK